MRIEYAKESGAKYLTIVQSLEEGEGELFLVFFFPYLIAIGVASRFAKVTGELRLRPP
jgi:hypothetical protein